MALIQMIQMLWNNFYSLGPMFVDYQNCTCSMGLNFVGDWFTTLKHRTIHDFGKHSWGRKFVGKGNPRNKSTLIPHEQ